MCSKLFKMKSINPGSLHKKKKAGIFLKLGLCPFISWQVKNVLITDSQRNLKIIFAA